MNAAIIAAFNEGTSARQRSGLRQNDILGLRDQLLAVEADDREFHLAEDTMNSFLKVLDELESAEGEDR